VSRSRKWKVSLQFSWKFFHSCSSTLNVLPLFLTLTLECEFTGVWQFSLNSLSSFSLLFQIPKKSVRRLSLLYIRLHSFGALIGAGTTGYFSGDVFNYLYTFPYGRRCFCGRVFRKIAAQQRITTKGPPDLFLF